MVLIKILISHSYSSFRHWPISHRVGAMQVFYGLAAALMPLRISIKKTKLARARRKLSRIQRVIVSRRLSPTNQGKPSSICITSFYALLNNPAQLRTIHYNDCFAGDAVEDVLFCGFCATNNLGGRAQTFGKIAPR